VGCVVMGCTGLYWGVVGVWLLWGAEVGPKVVQELLRALGRGGPGAAGRVPGGLLRAAPAPRGEMLISLVRGMEKALMMYCKGTIRPAGAYQGHTLEEGAYYVPYCKGIDALQVHMMYCEGCTQRKRGCTQRRHS